MNSTMTFAAALTVSTATEALATFDASLQTRVHPMVKSTTNLGGIMASRHDFRRIQAASWWSHPYLVAQKKAYFKLAFDIIILDQHLQWWYGVLLIHAWTTSCCIVINLNSNRVIYDVLCLWFWSTFEMTETLRFRKTMHVRMLSIYPNLPRYRTCSFVDLTISLTWSSLKTSG